MSTGLLIDSDTKMSNILSIKGSGISVSVWVHPLSIHFFPSIYTSAGLSLSVCLVLKSVVRFVQSEMLHMKKDNILNYINQINLYIR